MTRRELSIPLETLAALLLADDGEVLMALADPEEIAAELDRRGLAYSWRDPQEDTATRLRRLFGEGRERPGDEQ